MKAQFFLDGMDVTETPLFQRARLGVGYLPQESSIFRGLSVEKNIRAVLEVSEKNPEMRDTMLEELLAEFGIGHLRNTPAVNLSGVNVGALKLPAHLPHVRHFCCWMSRLPVLTRLRLATVT